jgi:hypothetical protein
MNTDNSSSHFSLQELLKIRAGQGVPPQLWDVAGQDEAETLAENAPRVGKSASSSPPIEFRVMPLCARAIFP